jgi:hypothetical protein
MIKQHSASRGKRAQALAEMAVMVPFLIIGMMGMLDLGRAFYYQIAITNAVREGARYAVQPYYLGLNPSCATPPQNPGANCQTASDGQIQQHVLDELAGTGINMTSSDIRVLPNQTDRVNAIIGATPTSQYPITVYASFKFYFITPIIGSLIGDPLTINTSAVFRAEY